MDAVRTLVLAGALALASGACRDVHLRGHLPPARPYGVMQFVPVGDTLVVGDRFRSGGGPLAGARIAAAFRSRALRAEYLAPARPVGQLAGRTITLADIVVSTEPSKDSVLAAWTVAGPEPLIRPYVAALRRASEDGGVFYDFNVVWVPVRTQRLTETTTR